MKASFTFLFSICLWASSLSAQSNIQQTLSVNSDGSAALPYAAADFPLTEVAECDFENNFVQFSQPFQMQTLNLGPDQNLCSSSIITLHAGSGFSSYAWHDGSTDATFTAYSPGIYWVNAQDACGNLQTDTVQVIPDAAAAVELGADVTLCDGETVLLNVPGFTSVQWHPVAGLICPDCPTTIAAPAVSTTYYVTAANGNCFASDSIRIFIGEKPAVDLMVQNGNCLLPASISAAVSGNAPFAFSWSGGQSGNTINPTQPGTYVVTVTDANGCEATASASVLIEGTLQLGITIHPVSCQGSMDGTAAVFPLNGTPPFSWLWLGGQTDSLISGLSGGAFAVTVTDAFGCTDVLSFSIAEPAGLALTIGGEAAVCAGETTGEAVANVIGGSPPYQYFWSNFQLTPVVTDLSPGAYSVTVTDKNGCTTEATTEIAALPASVFEFSDHFCEGENYFFNGETISLPGNYTAVLPAANSCDSTVTLHLEMWSNSFTALDTAILPGNPVLGVTVFQDTTFDVTFEAANGCDSIVQVIVDVIVSASETTNSKLALRILPNPNHGGFTLSGRLPEGGFCEAKLLDALGREVVQLFENQWLAGEFSWQTQALDLAEGVYFAELRSEWQRVAVRIIVQK